MSSRRLASALLFAVLFAPPARAAGDYRFAKQLDLAAGGTFSLRTEVGDVYVRGGEGGQAAVIVTSDRSDFGELFVTRFEATRPDRVELVVERKSRGPASWFQSFRSQTRIEVTLPASAAAELAASGGRVEVSNLAGAVRAESSGGGLQATDLGGDATLSSSGGRVNAERIRGGLTARSSGGGVEARTIGGAARLESSGGPIEAEDVGGDLEASSSGGGVRIREAKGAVVAGSSGGAVSVGFAADNAKGGRLDSSGGGVTATLDPSVALEIDASASGGHVDSDLPVTVQGKLSRDTLRGKLNGGGALLRLRSSGGSVTIASR